MCFFGWALSCSRLGGRKTAGAAAILGLDKAVGEQGAVVVLLTRLSPIFPFSLLNYGLGLTQVKLSHYVLASWLGMIPGTVLYVYLALSRRI